MSSFLSPQAFKLSAVGFLFIVFLMPLNLSGNEDKVSKLFNYVQIPYTYIEVQKDLNE